MKKARPYDTYGNFWRVMRQKQVHHWHQLNHRQEQRRSWIVALFAMFLIAVTIAVQVGYKLHWLKP